MKKYIMISSFLLFSFSLTFGQDVFLRKEVSKLENINSLSDWKRNALSDKYNLTKIDDQTKKPGEEWCHEKYGISYDGIPLEYGIVIVHKQNGDIKLITGEYYQQLDKIQLIPNINELQAFDIACKYIGSKKYIWNDSNMLHYMDKTDQLYLQNRPKGELVICKDYMNSESTKCSLSYKFEIYSTEPLIRGYLYVNAISGEILHWNSIIDYVNGPASTRYSGTQTISTESFNGHFRLNDLSRGNGIETLNAIGNNTPPQSVTNAVDFTDNNNLWTAQEFDNSDKDNAALDAHWGAMMTYDYFLQVHGRNSFDGQGKKLTNYVHHATLPALNFIYSGAFWDGNSSIFLGDGIIDITDPLTDLDIMAHEWGHGVNTYSAALVPHNESGAINESLSDIWAACVSNFAGKSNIWNLGEDHDLVGQGDRFMYCPKCTQLPDTYNGEYYMDVIDCTPDATQFNPGNDQCYVHTNMGVLNYWFYLLSVGGTGTNDNGYQYDVQGIGIDKAEQIVYKALTDYYTYNTTFFAASYLTTYAAQEKYGWCSNEVVSVMEAFHAVGLPVDLNISLNIYITHPITWNTIFSAINKIEASGNNVIYSDAHYRAGNTIILKSGFQVRSGASFLATTGGCANNFPSNRLSEKSNLTANNNPNEVYTDIDDNITISPNPTNGVISISSKINKNNSKFTKVIIYNNIGQVVVNTILKNNRGEIDLSRFPSGIYLLSIVSDKSNKTFKIIKN